MFLLSDTAVLIFLALRRLPGVDYGEAAACEIPGVAGGKTGAGNQGRRGDLGVEGLDRAAFAAAGRDNLRVMDGSSLLEGQHAAQKSSANIASAAAASARRRRPSGSTAMP